MQSPRRTTNHPGMEPTKKPSGAYEDRNEVVRLTRSRFETFRQPGDKGKAQSELRGGELQS